MKGTFVFITIAAASALITACDSRQDEYKSNPRGAAAPPTAQTERQQVSEQVRKEDVEIEESGEASRLHGETGKAANRLREQQEKPRSQRQQNS